MNLNQGRIWSFPLLVLSQGTVPTRWWKWLEVTLGQMHAGGEEHGEEGRRKRKKRLPGGIGREHPGNLGSLFPLPHIFSTVSLALPQTGTESPQKI